ncbi:Phosphoglucomutase [Candidatus Hepatincolaceae symbiont of Richtersius coronifer]
MEIATINSVTFADQNPGTSGLRKKTSIFLQPHYTANYAQAAMEVMKVKDKTFVIGGDGRYYTKQALNIIVSIGIANGAKQILIAKNALLSTPSASNIIRKYKLDFGFILSASHNPGGIYGDFGIKINDNKGAPLSSFFTDNIYKVSQTISKYKTLENFNLDCTKETEQTILGTQIKIIDPIADYANMMEEIFDFNEIYDLFHKKNFKLMYDGLNGVTGNYAKEIFSNRLGLSNEFLINHISQEDFGGLIPDPSPSTSLNFIKSVRNNPQINLGCSCDADGDRNFIFSQNNFLEPSDSLAVILQYSHLFNYYKDQIYGVGRSKATSNAVDLVAQDLGLNCYVVPTGWKYFSNLLEAKKITFCGEESFGTSSNHLREKDGLWAILFWLSIIAKTNKSLDELLKILWTKYGRVFFMRKDFTNLNDEKVQAIYNNLQSSATIGIKSTNSKINAISTSRYFIKSFNEFSYTDPVENNLILTKDLVINFNNNAQLVLRTSGTGTGGKIVRLYLSEHCLDQNKIDYNKTVYLKSLIENTYKIIDIPNFVPDSVI